MLQEIRRTHEAQRCPGSTMSTRLRIMDELHRPILDKDTAATQFGAGVPSSSCCHSGGSGSIGYISSRTSSRALTSIKRLP